MNPSDSLQLDEHLARLLAIYDPALSNGNGYAPTLNLIPVPGASPVPVADGSQADASDPNAAHAEPFADSLPHSLTPFPEVHRIGRFELRRQLGRGGCGIVFLAYDPILKREVALKIPRPELLLSADARRRLMREAHAAAEFDHPNLVPVYETGEIGPVCFIATAYCPGQTLAEWLERQAYPVPVRQAARLIAQVADAVQHAHDRGVLHRDLKPNNILLQETRIDPSDQGPPPGACPLRGDYFVPKVVDFGLAKLSESGPQETNSRHIIGTPKYMAPEQARGLRQDVGPPADVYALGATLYELIVGRAPFDGPTDMDVLRQVAEGHAPAPRTIRPDIPRDLEAICLKAMARNTARRYRTAIDLADDLRRFLNELPTLARPLNRLGRTARWLRRNDQAVALVMVTVVAVYFSVLGLWNRSETQELRTAQFSDRAYQMRRNGEREYARNVRDAFLSWRAGDARQMVESLADARAVATSAGESRDFAWGYLSRLGRAERFSVPCPPGAAVALAVARSTPRVATGHRDGTLAIRDRQTGERLGSVNAFANGVSHVGFLNGGARVVAAGGEPAARIWEIGPKGGLQPGPILPQLQGPVTALAVSADGQHIAVASEVGDSLVWNTATGAVVKAFAGNGRPIAAVALSPDGGTFAEIGKDGPVRLWNLLAKGSDEPTGEITGAEGATVLAFAPAAGDKWLLAAAGRNDGSVRLFDPQGREVRNLSGHTSPVLALDVSRDGTSVASGGADDSVCVWDVATGSMRALLRGHDQVIRGVRFGPHGRHLFTTADDGLMKVWDLTADPDGQADRGLPAAVTDVAVAPDGQRYAVALADGAVAVYPNRETRPVRIPGDGRGRVTAIKFLSDGPPVGVELSGRSAFVWEFGPMPRLVLRARTAEGSTATVVDFAADRVAVGGDRGRVAVWSLSESRMIGEFDTGLPGPVHYLCLSDDGQLVAAQTSDYQVGIWKVGEMKRQSQVPGHGEGLWLIRFVPGGKSLVTAGRGSSIKVWNLASETEDMALRGHVGRVTALAVSPDARTLVSGSGTGEVKLWDLRTGLELIGLRRHTGPVAAAEFGREGNILLTGGRASGGRGEVVFWDAARE